MEIIIKILTIRAKSTAKLAAAEQLVNDQDNDIFICEIDIFSKNFAYPEITGFNKLFAGWNNARYFGDTKYFVTDTIEKTITIE